MTDRQPIRVGVIGLGVGERHLVAYESTPGCEVTAVCDIDTERLREVANRHNIPGRFEDYRKITEDPEIDAVSICSYDDVHVEQAVSAFRHGKHVMLEKPIALFRKDAQRLLEAQQESGRILTSNLILRASPRFRAVKKMADEGWFGDIYYMEGDYLHDILWKLTEGWRGKMAFYSTVFGGGIHLIDLMRWIANREVVEVSGMGTDLLTRGSAYSYDETVVALLRFEDGLLAKNTTTLGPKRTKFHALDVYGTKGTFVNDMPDGKLFTSSEPGSEEPMREHYPAMEKGDLLPDFIAAIGEGRLPLVDHIDVFRVMDVCFAVVESLEQKKTVPVTYSI